MMIEDALTPTNEVLNRITTIMRDVSKTAVASLNIFMTI